MKLIGFTGAGGTGKSSIAQIIGNNVLSHVDETRKMLYGENAKYGDLKSIEFLTFQHLILEIQFYAETITLKRSSNDTTIIPIERSSIDYAAYVLNQKSVESNWDKDLNLLADQYIIKCLDHANNTYQGMVYFPIGKFPLSSDGRATKENNTQSIEKTNHYIQELLARLTIPVLTLKSVNKEDRVKEILEYFG